MSDMFKDVEVRPMAVDEVHRINEIDVSEKGRIVYKWVNGVVQAVPEEWERPRSYGDGWKARVDMVRAGMSRGGIALGAFDGEQLVAFAAMRYRLEDEVAQLVALWVDAGYRRRRIAARLVDQAVKAARDAGATAVYVSGCPSESAMGFYRSRGFAPTAFVHRELYELEPEDIHMILRL